MVTLGVGLGVISGAVYGEFRRGLIGDIGSGLGVIWSAVYGEFGRGLRVTVGVAHGDNWAWPHGDVVCDVFGDISMSSSLCHGESVATS
jgi:hypothetical protein